MKLCIPVSSPDGFDSLIEANFRHAGFLFLFDTQTRQHETVVLPVGSRNAGLNVQYDAVLCAGVDRQLLATLNERGVKVYVTKLPSVAQAIAAYEAGTLAALAPPASASHGHVHAAGEAAGGCSEAHTADVHDCAGAADAHHCGGHSHNGGHGHCGGHGGGRAANVHGGGCAGRGSQDRALAERPASSIMRIAVTSQNRKTVTEHAGKCRKFWIFEVHGKEIVGKTLLELGIEQSLHAASGAEPHPLDAIEVLITAGAGAGLQQRLARMGTRAVVTTETDPERVVAAYLAGRGKDEDSPARRTPCSPTGESPQKEPPRAVR